MGKYNNKINGSIRKMQTIQKVINLLIHRYASLKHLKFELEARMDQQKFLALLQRRSIRLSFYIVNGSELKNQQFIKRKKQAKSQDDQEAIRKPLLS